MREVDVEAESLHFHIEAVFSYLGHFLAIQSDQQKSVTLAAAEQQHDFIRAVIDNLSYLCLRILSQQSTQVVLLVLLLANLLAVECEKCLELV